MSVKKESNKKTNLPVAQETLMMSLGPFFGLVRCHSSAAVLPFPQPFVVVSIPTPRAAAHSGGSEWWGNGCVGRHHGLEAAVSLYHR